MVTTPSTVTFSGSARSGTPPRLRGGPQSPHRQRLGHRNTPAGAGVFRFMESESKLLAYPEARDALLGVVVVYPRGRIAEIAGKLLDVPHSSSVHFS